VVSKHQVSDDGALSSILPKRRKPTLQGTGTSKIYSAPHQIVHQPSHALEHSLSN
jgi:hypothetical protein